jgi:hypothetical protein
MFIRLMIRIFQLVFSAAILFFSHNKSANNFFQPAYQHNRTGPLYHGTEITVVVAAAGSFTFTTVTSGGIYT